jgi:hypothetical protein
VRRQARNELAGRGIIGSSCSSCFFSDEGANGVVATEGEIRKWKAARERDSLAAAETESGPSGTPPSTNPTEK